MAHVYKIDFDETGPRCVLPRQAVLRNLRLLLLSRRRARLSHVNPSPQVRLITIRLFLMIIDGDRSIHIERECLGCFYFCKAWLFCKTSKKYFYFFTTQNIGAVAADLLYKSVLGLCLIISRAARYLPKLALNNIPSQCVYYDL